MTPLIKCTKGNSWGWGRASATTSGGPVTGPRTTNVLANLKNWKLNLEKLESHFEQLEHSLELLEHCIAPLRGFRLLSFRPESVFLLPCLA